MLTFFFFFFNRRKRKSEPSEKQLQQPPKKYQIKQSKLTTTSPPYNKSSTDVLFGRWHARASLHNTNYYQQPNEYKYTDYHSPSTPETVSQHYHHHSRSLSTHSSSSSMSTSTYNQSPTTIPFTHSPPPMMKHPSTIKSPHIPLADLHQLATGTTSWGVRLPPLKAIMNEYENDTMPLVPLLLPPPSPLIHSPYYY